MNRYIRKLLFILFSLFYLYHAFSEDKVIRKIYIKIPAEIENRELFTLKQYLIIEISKNTDLIVVEKEENSDCVLFLNIIKNNNGQTIEITAKDTYFKKDVFRVNRKIKDFSIAELIENGSFKDISALIAKDFPPRNPKIVEVVKEKVVQKVKVEKVVKAVALTIKGAPNTILISKKGKKYQLDKTGTFILKNLPMESTVSFRAENPHYYPENFTVVLEKKDLTYVIKQQKASRFGIDIVLNSEGNFVPYFLYYTKPNWDYLYFYINHNMNLVRNLLSGNLSWHFNNDILYIQPSVGYGIYFFPADNFIRISLKTAIFTRVVFGNNFVPYISKILTIGDESGFSIEISPWKKLRLYLEYLPKIFYSSIFKNYLPVQGDSYTIKLISNTYLYYMENTYLGVRILF